MNIEKIISSVNKFDAEAALRQTKEMECMDIAIACQFNMIAMQN